ncbi:MAG: excinuclease ABC subunit C [Candidatus Magasanikbacteria bacterium RIFCSPHIGHO2_01_FULL_47_8]|uniref:UvrABC system protein C n=1 Tax=Candidatus Magasanikbacteria bacterium RIFCSPHIGHO2_01_FULL_47_8 TaxID=1798673 RepID=A0A1F6MCP0_9BACT|nr:MAG: excinuclease ABC subunit C [Candidatus Magasanikbacteria bacterium RIFCSPHIGHO2_01_FULL_47_8]
MSRPVNTCIIKDVTSLKDKLKNLPTRPGVYQFKNDRGEVLYVGKAKNLRSRVRTYFLNGRDWEPRLLIMRGQIADLDYTVVSSETESLMLENNLIKQYQPRFNVSLRDDKNFAFIKIDYDQQIPQIYPVRHLEKKQKGRARYFGPYTGSVKWTLKLISNIFQLCRSKKVTDRACFAYHLGRCPGVCFGKMPLAEYRQSFKHIENFLKHRQAEVVKNLKEQMKIAAAERRFEKAAAARDKLKALSRLWERQKIISPKKEDQDYLGLFQTAREAVVAMFLVREGRLIHTEYFNLTHENAAQEEILEKFLLQFYPQTSDPPREIYFAARLPNHDLIARTLSELKGQKIELVVPARGKKRQLLNLAAENAAMYHERELASWEKDQAGVLDDLKTRLNLPAVPKRIEGFDISNIQGTNPVGSMVVFENGNPAKNEYRKFKINVKETPDDFAMMREMLERRFARSTRSLGEGGWTLPDLIIIDGGKGQLNVGVSVLKKHNLDIPVLGLAKRIEEIFTPGRKSPILLEPNNPVLFLLQRIRDEAHRFAITFYRARHRKTQTYSRLSDISGVGPVTRKKLLKKFGSVSAIRAASFAAVAAEVGRAAAKKIRENL